MTTPQEKPQHSLTIFPDLHFLIDVENGKVQVTLTISAITRISYNGEIDETKHSRPHFSAVISMPSKEAAQAWVRRVSSTFLEELHEPLMIAAYDHLGIVGNFLLNEMGIESVDVAAYIDEQAKFRARDTKRSLELSLVGKFSPWTKTDLERALRQVLLPLPKEKRTQAAAARKLQETFPDQAPKNGESLRQLMYRLGVDWKRLKNVK